MLIATMSFLPFRSGQRSILSHQLVPTDRSQRRLVGRSALVPDIDLAAFSFRAVFDWIEFEVHLGRTTQAQHVQSVLRRHLKRNSYIAPTDLGPGDTFTRCAIRIQDPPNMAFVSQIHRDLVEVYGEVEASRVTAFEVSVDACPRKPSDHARAQLLGAMQRTIWTGRDIWSDSNSRPRTITGRGEDTVVKLTPRPEEAGTWCCASNPHNHRAPFIDGTMYLGRRDGPFMIRVMDKVKDKQRPDGSIEDLCNERRRVRIEGTIRGSELLSLGITDVPSLRQLRVTSLKKKFFQFRLPAFKVSPTATRASERNGNFFEARRAQTYLRSGVIGLKAMDIAIAECRRRDRPAQLAAQRKLLQSMGLTLHPRVREPRLEPALVSWNEMNRKVDVAFRKLEAREKTAWTKMVEVVSA
jgi:hypothetical protein